MHLRKEITQYQIMVVYQVSQACDRDLRLKIGIRDLRIGIDGKIHTDPDQTLWDNGSKY